MPVKLKVSEYQKKRALNRHEKLENPTSKTRKLNLLIDSFLTAPGAKPDSFGLGKSGQNPHCRILQRLDETLAV
jgi:hypothetical protein